MSTWSHADRVMSSIMGHGGSGPPADTRIGTPIAKSWRRCLTEYGLEPQKVSHADVLSPGELKLACARIEGLIAAAQPELRRLLGLLQASDYILTMTDARGVAVVAQYAAALRGQVELARTVAGSVWREENQGINGIGTCLKERAPLSVVMEDHFAMHLLNLSCTVVPMFDGKGVTLPPNSIQS